MLVWRALIHLLCDRAQDCELVANPDAFPSTLRLQSIRKQTRPLDYGFFDLCKYAGKKLVGGNPKNYLACESSL
jgi:hypothetical protein